MNKTLIALAIAAALPVAAQADMTLSGSVTSAYKNTGVIDTDAALSLSASEVLANGMTATATLDVLAGESQGSATLTGDFGSLTVGEITNDAAFQSGDVADVVGASDDSDDGDTTVSGIHFSTTQAGLSLAAQVNAGTGPLGTGTETKSTQMGATYDFNGLTVGYAYASGAANGDTAVEGVEEAQTAFGASYTFGDLAVSAGKSSIAAEALVSATYTMAIESLTVVAQMDNTPTGDYQINLSYAMSDALTLSSEIDKGLTTTLVASYTSGDVTASVSKTDDGTTDASVALDLGNADLSVARNGGDADTTVTYKVAF